MLLEIKDLHASINGKQILKGVDLKVDKGEIHAIMGPNGNGKSTLASVIAGKEMFHVDSGEILYKGKNLFDLNVEERACEGIFLGFQYPVEIPGVSIASFMRAALNEQRKYKGLDPIDTFEFMKYMEEKQALVGMTDRLANRSVNEGFSGGEKKKNEIFQMAMLQPTLAILDETDSGLDIDALRIVAQGTGSQRLRLAQRQRGAVRSCTMECGCSKAALILHDSGNKGFRHPFPEFRPSGLFRKESRCRTFANSN